MITLIGSGTVFVEQDETYTEYGATAADDKDGDITSGIVINGTVDTAIPGDYAITYNVKDIAGNIADEVKRTVTVVKSKTIFSETKTRLEAQAYPSLAFTSAVNGDLVVMANNGISLQWTFDSALDMKVKTSPFTPELVE